MKISFAVLVIFGSFIAVEFGLVDSGTSSSSAELAAQRSDEKTASRGSARTDEVSLAALQIATASANASFVAPSDELDPTTTTTSTTVPPTTIPPTTLLPVTLPPVTTTTRPLPRPTTTAPPTTSAPRPPAASGSNSETGKASYYAYKAGGCAHKTLPKGTVVTVTNVGNGKTATCVVNDRGPFVTGRIIDLDTSVFRQVASTSAGVFSARISW